MTDSKRPRGNKSSNATIRRRQAQEIDLVDAGLLQKDVAAELGVHRTTVYRNLLPLDIDWANANLEKLAPLKKKFIEEIAERANDLLNGRITAEAANAWRGLMAEFAKVAGLHAPTRVESQSVRLNLDADPASMRLWQRAVYELRNIPEVKLPGFWERVKPIIAELEEREVLDASFYPPKKELSHGGD